MKLGEKYWVRVNKTDGFFVAAFYSTRKDCVASYAKFYDKRNWCAMQVRVLVVPRSRRPR